MGSSFHGLHPLHLRLVAAGPPVTMVESSELLHYQRRLLQPGTLLVLVSQSGRSAEIVRLLETAGDAVDTLGRHEHRRQPAGEASRPPSLLTHAGEEATVACKTHLATQAALVWLGTRLTGGDVDETREALAATVPGVRDYLAEWRGRVEEMAGLLHDVRAVYYVGRGPSLGTVVLGRADHEGVHPSARRRASAAPRSGTGRWRCSTTASSSWSSPARIETRGLNEALVADTRAAGARAFLASEDAELPALRLPAVPKPGAAGRRAAPGGDAHPRHPRPRRPRGRHVPNRGKGDDHDGT